MRKVTVFVAILLCGVLLLAACQEQTVSDPKQTTGSSPSADTSQVTNPTKPEQTTAPTQPSAQRKLIEPPSGLEYVPGTILLDNQDDDDYSFQRSYRALYYSVYGEFFELLTEEQLMDSVDWLEEQSAQMKYGELQEEMLLVSFVKRYKISRKDFDTAVELYISHQGFISATMLHESSEIPNADVIYTFDNEIINYYYRYE